MLLCQVTLSPDTILIPLCKSKDLLRDPQRLSLVSRGNVEMKKSMSFCKVLQYTTEPTNDLPLQ